MMKKDLTLIYSDSAEKAAFAPIAKEAERRGYKVTLSDDPFIKSEIGFYCQHNNFPQYSKFSIIMLHDIIQQYGNWPDIWFREPWDKYDIGILPSDQWENNWNQCSQWKYARPRKGIYKIGWPKADAIIELKNNVYKKDFYLKHGMDPSKRTILYAPAWENDKKEDDFVRSTLPLGVNILIKQWDADPAKFPSQVKNVKEMAELHCNIPGVTILPPSTNIFEAIAVSDILVSEESSTMCEAAMMSVPAVSVSDWLIPDVKPSRLPKCDYDFVTFSSKESLESTLREMLNNYEYYYKRIHDFSEHNFLNIGNTSSMIMDIIDDCVDGKQIRYQSLVAKENQEVPVKKEIKRRIRNFKMAMTYNYNKRYPIVGGIWSILSHVRHFNDGTYSKKQ